MLSVRESEMRVGVLLAGWVMLCVGTLLAGGREEGPRPKLAVLLCFDQLRGDYLARWRDLFEKDGFRRLTDEGAWFTDCHYPYANTFTGPGHASIAAGCSPDVHGIIANDWYDRTAGKNVNCVSAIRYRQVPPRRTKDKDEKEPASASPERLLAPTIADALKQATDGKGRVVALSFKNRSAVLPGGKRPDAVYWVDKDGQFVTSTYYRDRVHPWAQELNESGLARRWAGSQWERLRGDLDYAKYSGPDDAPGEGKGSSQGRTFPHPFYGGKMKSRTEYLAALANSPHGMDFLMELVKKAVVAERLGTRDVPDLLSVSFSSPDLVGHTWGPDSQEVLDVTLRSDLIVRDLLRFLDDTVGKGNYLVALSADHGICPLPEAMRVKGVSAGRIDPKKLTEAAEDFLNASFPANGAEEKKDAKKGWIASLVGNMIYLNRAVVAQREAKIADVSRKLADWLAKQRGVQAAFTADEVRGPASDDPLRRQVQRSFFDGRTGDVTIIVKPYHFISSALTGTTHGSPHAYDTHVPLVAYGAGVKPGVRKERVSPEAVAVILSAGLGIAPPAKAAVKVPAGLFTE